MLGAKQGTVIAADSTSLNLFKALHVALDANPGRDTIVTDIDNFPTDLYVIDAVARQRGSAIAVYRDAHPRFITDVRCYFVAHLER